MGLALLVEGATPWVARRAMAGTPVHASHLPERFGLFTIIVLGESLVAVVIGISDTDWRLGSALVAAAGFVAVACLWWIYFDFIDLLDIKRGLLSRNVFIYGHLPVAVGLTAAGVGIKKAILYANEPALPAAGAWALCGGTALFLGAVGLIYAISTRSTHTRNLAAHAVTALIALCLAGGATIAPPVLIGLLLLTLLSLLAFEAIEKRPRETTRHEGSSVPEKSE